MAVTRVAARTAQPRLVICVGDIPEVGAYVHAAEGQRYSVEEVIRYKSNSAGSSDASYFGVRLGGEAALPRPGADLTLAPAQT